MVLTEISVDTKLLLIIIAEVLVALAVERKFVKRLLANVVLIEIFTNTRSLFLFSNIAINVLMHFVATSKQFFFKI